jgi:excisionase family DNA binding protein
MKYPSGGPYMEGYFDVDAAGAYLGVQPSTVYTWWLNGKLPGIKLTRHTLRFRRTDIDALCAAHYGFYRNPSVSPEQEDTP